MMRKLQSCVQCQGITKAGRRCSIDSHSKMKNERGKLVGEPLLHGSRFCLIHAQIFQYEPAIITSPTLLLFYLDFETTGLGMITERTRARLYTCTCACAQQSCPRLDVLDDNIVEIGLLECEGLAVFTTVVCPPQLPPEEVPTVHGISVDELRQGPCFAVAFHRMVSFIRNLVEMAIHDTDDSSCDECAAPTLSENSPRVVIVGHNIYRFDLPILLSECHRNAIQFDALEQWYFMDTLEICRLLDPGLSGGCVKLQCMLKTFLGPQDSLCAHRALDDCHALRGVIRAIALRLGLTLRRLARQFSVAMCATACLEQLSSLM